MWVTLCNEREVECSCLVKSKNQIGMFAVKINKEWREGRNEGIEIDKDEMKCLSSQKYLNDFKSNRNEWDKEKRKQI